MYDDTEHPYLHQRIASPLHLCVEYTYMYACLNYNAQISNSSNITPKLSLRLSPPLDWESLDEASIQ